MALTNEDLQAIANLFDSKMDEKLQPINSRLDKMDIRFDKLESEMSSLRAGQISIIKELKEVHHKVADTYDLALDTWGKSTEDRNWLEALSE